jgi:hypothetical protein
MEEKTLNTFGYFPTFYNKINKYDVVKKWVHDTIAFVTNGGNSFYVTTERVNGEEKTNRIKNFHTSINKSIKIAIDDEETNKKFKMMKIKDIIENELENITYLEYNFIPNSPLKENKLYKDILNVYKGAPIKYDNKFKIDMKLINPFLRHIKEVLADNNDKNEEYILSMLSHYIQRPHIKTNVCMVFISDEEGAGKNIFFDNFNQKLIGSNYTTNIDNLDTLFGRFNGIIANKIVTVLDEVKTKFGGKSSDQFKSMVTQKFLNLEEKGMEHIKINDYNNYIILTNNEVPVNIDISDRRFFVSNVSNKYVGDYEYFDKLQDLFDDNEAIKHFYHYLLTYNISKFKPQRDIPVTERKIDIKYESLKSPVKFMVAVAANRIEYGIDGKDINSDILYNSYIDFCATYDKCIPYRKLDFFKQIKKLISIPIINYKDKKKNKIYNINKKHVKEALVKYFKTDIDNICDIISEEFSFTNSEEESSETSGTSNESNTEDITIESENTDSSTNYTYYDDLENNNPLDSLSEKIEIVKVKGQAGLYKCIINGKTKMGSYDTLKDLIDKYEKNQIKRLGIDLNNL